MGVFFKDCKEIHRIFKGFRGFKFDFRGILKRFRDFIRI